MTMQPIPAPTLKHWLDTGQAHLVDVREPAEFAAGHIPGAVLQPLATVTRSTLPQDGKKLVMQCKAGRRGGTACEKLLAEDPSLELYNLEGGIDGWVAAGLPLSGTGKHILPLDRQVQLTIGAVLLAASISGYLTSTAAFFFLTGLIGIGLSIAGLTGFCGLAHVLARMPWNQRTS